MVLEGCSCHELEPQNDTNSDAFDSFQSLRLKSSKKKGYYALKPPIRTVSVGGSLEMGTYKKESNVPMNLMDAPVSDSFASVRKSSSASSLQDPDGNSNNGSSSLSLWSTSTPAAITSSIFDGLPKPLTGRRNKTAMD
ncbi:hypothetical protein HID58_045099 [Brassica napus]|uniref:Uncharacterized protein n=1 Tax=Brassica napus TaxID=3708 RepID=A0ABQ8ASL7_BRANA|nr:hypothetical protein HID58_045099 [Brassica napus]